MSRVPIVVSLLLVAGLMVADGCRCSRETAQLPEVSLPPLRKASEVTRADVYRDDGKWVVVFTQRITNGLEQAFVVDTAKGVVSYALEDRPEALAVVLKLPGPPKSGSGGSGTVGGSAYNPSSGDSADGGSITINSVASVYTLVQVARVHLVESELPGPLMLTVPRYTLPPPGIPMTFPMPEGSAARPE